MNYKDILAMGEAYKKVAEAGCKTPKNEAMDPVDAKELKGKHKDRKDKDIDNDGDVDIVIAARDFNTVDEIRFYENDGSINFVYTVIDTVDLLWDTEVADFDGNGEQDIVVSSLGSDLFIFTL